MPSAIGPMNWCDGIGASDIRHTIGVPQVMTSSQHRSEPYEGEMYIRSKTEVKVRVGK